MLCSWCDDEATVFLVSDADSHHGVDAACDVHDAMWAKLYRRSVSVSHHAVTDLRSRHDVDPAQGAQRGTVA